MNCEACRDLLPRFATEETQVGDPAMSAARDHVSECAACRREADAYRKMLLSLRAIPAAREGVPIGYLERLHAALDRVDVSGGTRAKVPGSRLKGTMRPSFRGLWATGGGLALLVVGLVWSGLLFSRWRGAPPVRDPRALYVTALGAVPSLETPDANRAAAWIAARTGSPMPPINLSLVGGDLAGASLVPEGKARIPVLLYRTREGMAVVAKARNQALAGGSWASRRDGRYRFDLLDGGLPGVASWISNGDRYFLIFPGSLARLLEIARAAARHCEVAS